MSEEWLFEPRNIEQLVSEIPNRELLDRLLNWYDSEEEEEFTYEDMYWELERRLLAIGWLAPGYMGKNPVKDEGNWDSSLGCWRTEG